MCYKQFKIAGGVGALRESDDTNFFLNPTPNFSLFKERIISSEPFCGLAAYLQVRHEYSSLETSDKWVRQSWHKIWVQGSRFGSLRCGAYSRQIPHCTASFAVLATADILLWCLLHVKISLPLVGQDLFCTNISIINQKFKWIPWCDP